ncbi:MAG: single-stranded-DNA-specific exonuclease RecJ [Candidatus Bipolaricaulota bacterium]|nr:single-stranded-DNA-specific exonuclease RecJ [Candidatus Bipolaricaulota bacterium]MDW8110580.1 single-stranded-DNA-specific exonuclease RecJ [Candidatus Bipolaricaulota bacterium]MDW8329508.1 single-stranded-DNA-specific exonuclease RecJ [Candidatus Bipolaricaulota bacterium]
MSLGQPSWRSLLTGRQWRLRAVSGERAAQLARELGCSAPLATVLAARAADRPQELLDHSLAALASPWSLLGLDKAVHRLMRALQRGERIFIQGDFDVDGLTSTALLYRGLQKLGAKEIKVDLSDRERGHGLSPPVVQRLITEGFQLLITADCGTSDGEFIQTLQDHRIDVIITDHHRPPERLPPAYAIVNPRQPGCPYVYKDLAAVGVAFQVLRGLYERCGQPPSACEEFLDLVLVGTIGDLVPLVRDGLAENQRLVANGLRCLAAGRGSSLGLRVLIKKLGLDVRHLSPGDFSYIIVPKLNAANRVGDPRVAFLLLTTQDPQRADFLASTLLAYNQDRQIAQDDLLFQAEELLRREPGWQEAPLIFLAGRYWNPGLLGLVASELAEKHHRPAIIVALGDEISRASCRSVPGFDIALALEEHRDLLERYGGHAMAAGFSIRNEKIPLLRERLRDYARALLPQRAQPIYEFEAELSPQELTLEVYYDLQRLAPFGIGHPEPRFLLRGARIQQWRTVGTNGDHLKCLIEAGGQTFPAIGFSLGEHALLLEEHQTLDLIFKLGCDTWSGRPQIQLEIEDILAPQAQELERPDL